MEYQPDKLYQALANKSQKFWASMRTNLSLMHRSDDFDEFQIDMVRQELSDILDSGILTYPQTLESIGLDQDTSLEERKEIFGIDNTQVQRSKAERVFLENMAYKADQCRKSNWSWRIGQEAEEKHYEEWHPFFITLTVDPQKTDPKQLWQEGREFRKYIRNLAKVVCKELGHPPPNKKPYRPESQYVTYAGVIEHGKSREHHHGHFIVWLRAIPSSWRVCPNFGIHNPSARIRNECVPMRSLWKWSLPGLSKALYFRSVGDIWERKYNFVLPLKEGKPMKVSVPRVAGAYITKYLSKEHKEWHHRMKATRNLGMKRLKTWMMGQTERVQEALTWRASNSQLHHSMMMIHSVPHGLLRSTAKQCLYLTRFRSNRLALTELLTTNTGIFQNMLWSVQAGRRPDRMHSLEFFDWVASLLPEQKGYCEDSFREAHKRLEQYWPQDRSKVKHVKIGGNEIGHS